MKHLFTAYLGCLGIVALVVIAFPAIVLIGLVAGVIPGILLGIAPTLFVYSLFWWAIRPLILKTARHVGLVPATDLGKRALRTATGALAILILAVPAILVPRAINARSRRLSRSCALRIERRRVL